MEPHLRAGVAIYNEGRYHAAHDAWEDRWLDLEADTDDELLLHGLIQFTAVVHHATNGNWAGVEGLAESAEAYLADLPATYRGIDLAPVRSFLADAAADPEAADPATAPPLTHQGDPLGYEDLDVESTLVAAAVLADEDDYDDTVIEDAGAYAREEVTTAGGGTFTGLLFSFVRDPDRRGLVFDRLERHVNRERSKDADVEGLFD
jgi:hypothetical protein